MKKICLCVLPLLVLLCGCTRVTSVDLYGFITEYNKSADLSIALTDFKAYEVNGVNAYIYSFENGTMLTLREGEGSSKIASCSLISEKESDELVTMFVELCSCFTGLDLKQCRKAADECKAQSQALSGCTFSYAKNGYAVCYRVEKGG